MAGDTFSDSDSAPVPKFLNQGPAILQIWESDSCSDSGCNNRSNRNLPMFLPKKWPHRILLLLNWKSDSRSGFSQIFDSGSGSEIKTQNPAGVDSGNPDPVPPLLYTRDNRIVNFTIRSYPVFQKWYPIRILFWLNSYYAYPKTIWKCIVIHNIHFLCCVYFALWGKITVGAFLPLAEHNWLK